MLKVAIVLFLYCSASQAQGPRLWVLEAPDQIVEYDPASFTRKNAHPVPKQAFLFPQDLQISRGGQMLFAAGMVREPDGFTHPSNSPSVWLWNGAIALPVMRSVSEKVTPAGANVTVESSLPRPALFADGSHIFWFDNHRKTLQKNDRSVDLSTATTFRAWQTDLMGMSPQPLASLPFADCKCETGVCSEGCPEAGVKVPEEGVADFFVLTQWVPGQIGSDYQASLLFRKGGGKWSSTKLAHPMQDILDFAAEGSDVLLLEAVLDAGCCGWANESSDQLILNRGASSAIVFDERQQFQNANYDVSFFPSRAKFSPNKHFIAMTVQASQKATDEIRLADEGHDTPAELAQIKKNLPNMPMVQVVPANGGSKPTASIAGCSLVGWLSDSEILMVENGMLVAFDIAKYTRRKSTIKMENASYAFLR
jgi:hypothetical protein